MTGPSTAELVDLPEPELLPGSVIVEVSRCGVGGSDMEAFLSGELPAPAWFGHEWSGRVVAMADDVGERFLGERVLGAAPPPCGACRPCRAGLGSQCRLVIDMIVGADGLASGHGAFAERVRADARRLRRVPEGIDDDDAALAEPAAVATHAVARAQLAIGDLVVVLGAGTIGLLVAELARVSGAGAVVAVDPDPMRRELACDLGADAAFAPGAEVTKWLASRGHGLGADASFDCAHRSSTLAAAAGLLRRGGTVVAVGIGNASGAMTAPELLVREADLRASQGYNVADVQRALELMVDERLRVRPVYDPEVIDLADLPPRLAEIASDPRGRLKTLVAPTFG